MSAPRLLIFDCDSTLSSIEGIDELGRLRGADVFAAVEAMTNDAMNGKLAVEKVFGRRLEIIQPRLSDVARIGQLYIETLEPTAVATLKVAREKGWTPLILSGGFRQAIRPLADHLGISRVEAVDLFFNADGSYRGFDEGYPTTRSGGKPEVVRSLRNELQPSRVIMVGDGVSDLEAKSEVDQFVGFGRYVQRAKVREGAHKFAGALSEVLDLL